LHRMRKAAAIGKNDGKKAKVNPVRRQKKCDWTMRSNIICQVCDGD
jgi:hypothetical protein